MRTGQKRQPLSAGSASAVGLRILCSKNSQLFYSCILTTYKYCAFSSNTYAQQNVYYSQFSCHRTCKWHNRKISKWKQASVSCHMRPLLAGCSILLQLSWSWYIGRISCVKATQKRRGRSVWLLVPSRCNRKSRFNTIRHFASPHGHVVRLPDKN